MVTTVIAIDDGSTDQTGEILQNLSQKYPNITVLGWKENRGKGFALLEGFQHTVNHTDFNTLVTIDSDAQHDPEDIPALVQAIQEGAHMAIASRHFHLMPGRSKFGNTLIAKMLKWIYNKAPHDTQSGYRAFSKILVEKFLKTIPGGRYETEFKCLLLALKEDHPISSVPTKTIYIDNNKSSHFSPIKDSLMILKTLWYHR